MNEKFAHTAGPWTVGTSSGNGIHCVDAIDPHRPGIVEICEVWGTFNDTEKDDMSLDNARLIAAAPELLEALYLLLNDVGRANSMLGAVKARAAIAKATGKTSEAA